GRRQRQWRVRPAGPPAHRPLGAGRRCDGRRLYRRPRPALAVPSQCRLLVCQRARRLLHAPDRVRSPRCTGGGLCLVQCPRHRGGRRPDPRRAEPRRHGRSHRAPVCRRSLPQRRRRRRHTESATIRQGKSVDRSEGLSRTARLSPRATIHCLRCTVMAADTPMKPEGEDFRILAVIPEGDIDLALGALEGARALTGCALRMVLAAPAASGIRTRSLPDTLILADADDGAALRRHLAITDLYLDLSANPNRERILAAQGARVPVLTRTEIKELASASYLVLPTPARTNP